MFNIGDIVWSAHTDIMGRLTLERYFILDRDHRGWYSIGSSRKRASSVYHTDDTSAFFDTKEEAFLDYKERHLKQLAREAENHEALAKKSKKSFKELKKRTIKGVRIKTYPEDYEPCDF